MFLGDDRYVRVSVALIREQHYCEMKRKRKLYYFRRFGIANLPNLGNVYCVLICKDIMHDDGVDDKKYHANNSIRMRKCETHIQRHKWKWHKWMLERKILRPTVNRNNIIYDGVSEITLQSGYFNGFTHPLYEWLWALGIVHWYGWMAHPTANVQTLAFSFVITLYVRVFSYKIHVRTQTLFARTRTRRSYH